MFSHSNLGAIITGTMNILPSLYLLVEIFVTHISLCYGVIVGYILCLIILMGI
jgi:hypothetical protein